MESVDKLILKIDEIMEQNKQIYPILESMTKKPTYTSNNYQPKEVDRDSQEYKNNRGIYLKKLNHREIKEQKQSTMDSYKIDLDEDTGFIHDHINL